MKTSVTNKLKKAFAFGVVASLPLFTACEKNNDNPNDNQPEQPKHNVELVYDANLVGIELSRIQDSLANSNVDSIFMVPDHYNQYSTTPTNGLKIIVKQLRDRHNLNPDKVFGKGELQLWNQSVLNNPEIVRFFADTLKYDVTYYNTTKSR